MTRRTRSAPADLAVSESRRRPRRPDLVRYRVRADLCGAKPPLWRRLELTSGLFLDEVHEILQVAFGWTDSHLHQFGSGPRYHGPGTEYYLCPYQVEEGEPGVPEEEVRLDEVIADPGDTMCYLYDFGDDWEHVIRLEAVATWDDTAPAAVCLDGRRDGPPEDCGGLGGYELISAAIDPLSPDHSDAVIEFERMYGIEFRSESNSPTHSGSMSSTPNWPSVFLPARGLSGQTRLTTCPARWRNSSARYGTAMHAGNCAG